MDSYPLDERGLCSICRESLINFDAAYSFGSFEGPLQQLVHLFKYGKVETLAGPLSRLLMRALPRDVRFDQVMAMPMHWRKKWERGFNQAELLAAPVASMMGLKLSPNLRRVRYTKAQASLDSRKRSENLKGSFCVKRPAQVSGKRILLIDDVFTTGASARAAAGELKSVGAAHVSVLTLARVDRRQQFQDSSAELAAERRASAVLTGTGPN